MSVTLEGVSEQDLILARDIISTIIKDDNLISLFNNTIGVYGRFNQCSLKSILIAIKGKLKIMVGSKDASQYVK